MNKNNEKIESLLLLRVLRFRAQILTSLSWLLGPLLIFTLTNDVKKAALLLIVEWTFRVIIMSSLSNAIQKRGGFNVLISVENTRIIIFLILSIICLFSYPENDSWLILFLLLIIQIIFQLCASTLNISCEGLAHSLSSSKEKGKAQLMMRQGDLLASLICLPTSGVIATYVPNGLFLVCLIAAFIAFLNKLKIIKLVESLNLTDTKESVGVIENNISNESVTKGLPKKAIILSFFMIFFNVPLALLWGMFFFWIDRLNSSNDMQDFMSLFYSNYKIIEIIFILLMINITMLLRKSSEKNILIFGSVLWFFGNILFFYEIFSGKASLVNSYLSILFLACGTVVVSSYVRALRQHLIPKELRFFWTTKLASLEGSSYIIAGSLLMILGLNSLLFPIIGTVGILGILLLSLFV